MNVLNIKLNKPPIQEMALSVAFGAPLVSEQDVARIVREIDGQFQSFGLVKEGQFKFDAQQGVPVTTQTESWVGTRFRNASNQFISIQNDKPNGAVVFSFNMTPPYKSWEEFMEPALRYLAGFVDRLPQKPKSYKRIGVRTIDRLEATPEAKSVRDVLKSALPDIEGAGAALVQDFNLRDTLYYRDYGLYVTTIRAMNPTPPGRFPVVFLDMDVFQPIEFPLDQKTLDDTLVKIHGLRNQVFVGSIGDVCWEACK